MRTFAKMLCTAAAVMLLPLSAAQAQISERTIKFAFLNQLDHPQGLGAKQFAEIVKQKSDGKITVKRFAGGTLGGDVQTLSALQGGTVEMTTMNAGILASVAKDFAMVDLPFLFESPKEADAVMDGPVGTTLAAELPESGLVGLGYWELGFRQLSNNRHPITDGTTSPA